MTPVVGWSLSLLIVGYVLSLTVLARWFSVVRNRNASWFAAHQVGVTAVIIGWLARGWPWVAAINVAWLASAALWWGRARHAH